MRHKSQHPHEGPTGGATTACTLIIPGSKLLGTNMTYTSLLYYLSRAGAQSGFRIQSLTRKAAIHLHVLLTFVDVRLHCQQ